MNTSEATEIAKDNILSHITSFTSLEVQKILNTQRSKGRKSNAELYSCEGASKSIQKIEIFVKPADIEYKIPQDLTSDSSLHNSVRCKPFPCLKPVA